MNADKNGPTAGRARQGHCDCSRPQAVATRLILALAVAAAIGSLMSTARAAASETAPIVRTARRGPVELTVTLDRATAQIAEPVKLSIAARAPEGVTITFPQHQTALGSFDVVKCSDTPDIPVDGGRLWTRDYQLECLSAGTQVIPPIAVAYRDSRQSTQPAATMESPSFEVTIASVLEGTPDPLQFRDIKDVVELRDEVDASSAWIAWSLAGAAVLTLAGVALLVVPSRQRRQTPARWALAELARLQSADLLASGQTHAFYCRLTDIVRSYVERQLGIAAPTLTTAEFLDEATQHESLDESRRALLREFLQLADLVKFARLEPGADGAHEAIGTARRFIEHAYTRENV
jgi:hypothetical protein